MPIINSEVRSSQLKIATGLHTTVAASDTIATGLKKVLYAFANLQSTPVQTAASATASVGDQAGTPDAGSILVQSWMPTSVTSTLPTAATTFGKVVSWIAIGY